jgi:hypothetical protein
LRIASANVLHIFTFPNTAVKFFHENFTKAQQKHAKNLFYKA